MPHFTSFRLAALELYPGDANVSFDVEEHKELCRDWCSRTDGLARALASKAFGLGGMQRERARTTTPSAISRLRPWATRRSCGSGR